MLKMKINLICCYHNLEKQLNYNEYNNIDIICKEEMTLKEFLEQIYSKYSENNYNKNEWYVKYEFDVDNHNEIFWKQFFNEEIYNKFLYKFEDYLKMTLKDLEKQFNIINITFPILLDSQGGRGGRVGEKEGIKFFFHTNEKEIHHIPHIHCKYSGKEMRINLNEIKLIDSPFKNKKKTECALQWCEKYRNNLIDYWNKVVVNGESIKMRLEI